MVWLVVVEVGTIEAAIDLRGRGVKTKEVVDTSVRMMQTGTGQGVMTSLVERVPVEVAGIISALSMTKQAGSLVERGHKTIRRGK